MTANAASTRAVKDVKWEIDFGRRQERLEGGRSLSGPGQEISPPVTSPCGSDSWPFQGHAADQNHFAPRGVTGHKSGP